MRCLATGAWDLEVEDPEAGLSSVLNLSTTAWEEVLQLAIDKELGRNDEIVESISMARGESLLLKVIEAAWKKIEKGQWIPSGNANEKHEVVTWENQEIGGLR